MGRDQRLARHPRERRDAGQKLVGHHAQRIEVLWMYIRSSNMNGTGVRRVGEGTMNAWGLYDVAGNVREWNANQLGSGRLTRGGSWEDSPFHIGHLISRDPFDRSADNGFRVARIRHHSRLGVVV